MGDHSLTNKLPHKASTAVVPSAAANRLQAEGSPSMYHCAYHDSACGLRAQGVDAFFAELALEYLAGGGARQRRLALP